MACRRRRIMILNFGNQFTGSARFLDISVRPAGGGAYTQLAPRQTISSTPYSIKSLSTDSAANSLQLAGIAANQYVVTSDLRLSDQRLPAAGSDNYIQNRTSQQPLSNFSISGNGVVGTNLSVGGVIIGNGAGLTNLTPANISSGTAAINIAGVSAKAMTATTGTSPSVSGVTFLVLNYAAPTTLTGLSDAVEGQCVTLLTLNNKININNGGNFRIASQWSRFNSDTMTVCMSSASGTPLWYERSRSNNAFTLSVSKSGTGSGTVTSSPGSINCGAACSDGFSAGTLVTLTATPAAGSVFAGWSGGGCTGTGTCTVTMNAAASVTATFNGTTYTLTVFVNDPQLGNVTSSPAGINCGSTCSATFNSGTVVTLTRGFIMQGTLFNGWGGDCAGTATTCTITMSAPRTVTATFSNPN